MKSLPRDSIVAVNCEYGASGNGLRHRVLPQTRFGLEIDETSARPGQQTCQKMVGVAGYSATQVFGGFGSVAGFIKARFRR